VSRSGYDAGAPKRSESLPTIAGRITDPFATTVAGDEPEIAATTRRQATARGEAAIPVTTIAVANAIMRRARAVGKEVAGENEKRDRHDLEAFDAVEKASTQPIQFARRST